MKTFGNIFLALLVPFAAADAHLMVEQHGTLNVVDDGVYMVLSLPLNAFDGVDEDGDGIISLLEFNAHRQTITAAVKRGVSLSDATGPLPLNGIVLSPVVPHDAAAADAAATQVVVMGRFAPCSTLGSLRFAATLYGERPAEQRLEITTTRRADNQKQVSVLTPTVPSAVFFSER